MMRNLLVLTSGTLLYVAIYIAGSHLWSQTGNYFIVALTFYVCLIPLLFGFVVRRLLRLESHWAFLVVLIIPIIADIVSILDYKIRTGWAPREYTTIVNSSMVVQALCVALGAYVGSWREEGATQRRETERK